MSEIPDDIMATAREAVSGIKCFPPSDFTALTISVALAILAERHRCFNTASAYGTRHGLPDGRTPAFRKHRHAIAEAILNA